MLCPGVEINRGQKKVLSGKLSAKDFVYAALPMIWSREVLCTHSVTGRKSNAHKEREAKPQLDAEKVNSLCSKYRNISIIIHLSLRFTTQCTVLLPKLYLEFYMIKVIFLIFSLFTSKYSYRLSVT